MATDILVPTLGESVTEATVAQWLKKPGEAVALDEPVVELETDKVTLEVNATSAGVLSEVLVDEGADVGVGALLGRIGDGKAAPAPESVAKAAPAKAPPTTLQDGDSGGGTRSDIVVPTLGESVTEATVAQWLKKPGDAVAADEPLVELETDKVTLEVNAAAAGVMGEIHAEAGADVEVGAVLGVLLAGASGEVAAVAESPATVAPPAEPEAAAPAASAPAAAAAPVLDPAEVRRTDGKITRDDLLSFLEKSLLGNVGPAVRKLIADKDLDPTVIPATGRDGRLTKEDVLDFLDGKTQPLTAPSAPVVPQTARQAPPSPPPAAPPPAAPPPAAVVEGAREERVKMTKLRQTIARRLKDSQNTAAMLTTFNEADMSAVMALRARYRESFEKKHGVRLGFTSFFAKAVVAGLKELPAVNARIDGDEMVYHKFYDIGMAVSTPNGLMVPVVRGCDQKSFAEIEKNLGELAARGREGKLGMAEITGGTFTITNGGVFGSMMSTPILNMPQSGILGLHKIQDRPMAVNGEVRIRPMMYLALSYDHRIIDGREAVTFLVRVKENIEDPERLLLDM